MPIDLGIAGRVAIVTGGSAGIGMATARLLAAEGARVVICARDKARLEGAAQQIAQETNGQLEAVAADVRDAGEIEKLFSAARQAFGPVSILVNNAGTAAAGRFNTVSDEVWEADLNLKLFGAIRCSRLALPDMLAAGWGRIVNLTAISGKTPGAGSLPTSVSRAAGIALTKALSKEVAGSGITVNTVCIGTVKSAQIDRMTAAMYPNLSLEDAYAEQAKTIPAGRVPDASEAADLIGFLVSARAGYITGVAINFDGGVSAAV